MSVAARTESGLPVRAVYGADALDGFDPPAGLGAPGQFPYTRGVYRSMYTGRPWTMRRYARFGTAKESNQRYHKLVSAGTDEPPARGKVGDLRRAAAGTGNVLPPIRDALALRATDGEIAHALRDVWGAYQPQETL